MVQKSNRQNMSTWKYNNIIASVYIPNLRILMLNLWEKCNKLMNRRVLCTDHCSGPVFTKQNHKWFRGNKQARIMTLYTCTPSSENLWLMVGEVSNLPSKHSLCYLGSCWGRWYKNFSKPVIRRFCSLANPWSLCAILSTHNAREILGIFSVANFSVHCWHLYKPKPDNNNPCRCYRVFLI